LSGFTKSTTYPWALTAIFAAFHLVLTFIPFSILGMGGGALTWGMVSAGIVGFLLGPFFGTISVLIGSLIGTGIFNLGGILGPIVPVLAPTAGAFAAGCLRTARVKELLLIFVIAVVLFFISPIGTLAFTTITLGSFIIPISFIWLHLITLLIIVILLIPRLANTLSDAVSFDKNRNVKLMPIAVLLFSFITLMTDHIVGNAASIYWLHYVALYDVPTLVGYWIPITFVYPVERLLATVILAIIVIAAGEAIVQTGLDLPVSPWESREQLELSPEEVGTE
jgi:hypothetical protein